MKYTIRNFQNFQKHFPDDNACLDYILQAKVKKNCTGCCRGKLYRVRNRKCYSCSFCGAQTHPLAKTIFEKSSTPLSMWFYSIYILAHSRTTPTAKKLERHLGVTYKTAWRISKKIRDLVKINGVYKTSENNFFNLLDLAKKP